MDNYRGITVTPVITKLFEYVLLPKLSHNFKQSTLQFGFKKGRIRGSGEGNYTNGQVRKLSPIYSLNLFLEFAYTF
jgi:hypothetical protein